MPKIVPHLWYDKEAKEAAEFYISLFESSKLVNTHVIKNPPPHDDAEIVSFELAGQPWLKSRGLRGVDLIVSDDHGGLVRSIRQQLQGVTWQRCQTHFMRNVLDASPKALKDEIHTHVRAILEAPNPEAARLLMQQTLGAYEDKAAKAMRILEAGFDDVTSVLSLPEKYRKRLRTTNSVERLNEEVRSRERVIRIFPNRESVIRLIGALLMEQDEKWASGKKYLDMVEYLERRESRPKSVSEVTRIM